MSPVDTMVFSPCAVARLASVAITSSASMPSISITGQPSARTAWWIGSICSARSSGIAFRLALYSAYMSSRKVFPLASNTHAR